jgi:hypothetical protein
MSRKLPDAERSPWDFILYAMTFFGLVLALGGVIIASAPVAVTGLIAIGVGLLYFGLQQWVSD